MPNNYTSYPGTLDSPATSAAAVTPADGTDLPYFTRALYIGTTGDLAVIMMDGSAVTFPTVPVGVLDIRVSRVKATGTTASNIVALF